MKNIIGLFNSLFLYSLCIILFTFTSCQKEDLIADADIGKSPQSRSLVKIEQAFPNHDKELITLSNGVIVEKVLGTERPLYIYQGDIVLEEEDLEQFFEVSTRGAIHINPEHIWTDNEVYYYINPDFRFTAELEEAIRHWEEKTYLKFILTIDSHDPTVPPIGPIDPENKSLNYIKFRNSNGNGTFSSYIGKRGLSQYIAVDDWAGAGEIIHEIGHAVGLFHEHSRLDRDDYVTIHWENMENSSSVRYQYNTWMESRYQGIDVGTFDFGSIMLYHSWAFSKYESGSSLFWDNPVMTKKNGETFNPQRIELSEQDILAVNYLYPEIEIPKEPTILTFNITDDSWMTGYRTIEFSKLILTGDTVFVDFGNGDTYKGLSSGIPNVTYPDGQYEVKIWTKKMNLQAKGGTGGLSFYYLPIIKVHLSKDTEFTGINFVMSHLEELTYNEAPDFSTITTFYETFKNTQLKSIKGDFFSKAVNATTFRWVFYCTQLTEIPVELFANNTLATMFSMVFYDNPITSIPSGLFDNNPLIETFTDVFKQTLITEIPEGLFDNNPLITTFSGTFGHCPITTIPEGLFDNNVEVISFRNVFYNTKIASIPSGLFDNNLKATDFSGTFNRCENLTSIPPNLFEVNIEATNFRGVFSSCYSLTSVAPQLFSSNTKATDFDWAFNGCNLITIPENLFSNNLLAKYFNATFGSNNSITSVPENLFRNQTLDCMFNQIFTYCVNLRTVPSSLFMSVGSNSQFDRAFYGCQNLEYAIPLWERYSYSYDNYCYNGCDNVSNWNDIPSNWK